MLVKSVHKSGTQGTGWQTAQEEVVYRMSCIHSQHSPVCQLPPHFLAGTGLPFIFSPVPPPVQYHFFSLCTYNAQVSPFFVL